jgi:phosphoserine phosphatase
LLDDDVHRAALDVPRSAEDAYRRLVASRLEAEARATIAYLRNAGAQVVRASPAGFGAASVAAYLGIKHRGLL